MNFTDFKQRYAQLNPQPKQPKLWQFVLRVDMILLSLAAIGGVIFSASRTFTLVAEQSGSAVAIFAVLALELSITGLIIAQGRHNTSWLMRTIRSSAAWLTILLLLFILVVTNASYEIRTVDLAVNEQVLKYILVFFLGVLIPILVLVNVENIATRIPESLTRYEQAVIEYNQRLALWEDGLRDSWQEEEDSQQGPEETRKVSKPKRLQQMREMLKDGITPNQTKLARQMGVSITTIAKDLKEIEMEEQEIERTF